MKKFIPLLFFILALASCEFINETEITLSFPEEHYWEYYSGKYMWHTLKVYDGEIRSYTIPSYERSFDIKVNRGSTCIFTLYPLGYLSPKGGWYVPGDDQSVSLKSRYGRFTDILLDVPQYNEKVLSSLHPGTLFSAIPEDFDSDELFYFFTEGKTNPSSIKKAKEIAVTIEDIPEGYYYPEGDDGEIIQVDEDGMIKIRLIPGMYRFMNFNRNLTCVIAVYSDGSFEYRIMASERW